MFQLFEILPRHDDRDVIVGWSAHAHPYTFLTVQGARAVAATRARRECQDLGEGYFTIVPLGKSPFDRNAQDHASYADMRCSYANARIARAMDDIPF